MESSVRVAVSSISGSLGLSPRRAPLPSLSMHKAYPVRGSSTEARFISLTRRRHWPRPAQARATMVSTCTSTSIEATHVLHIVLVHRRPPNKSQLQVHLFPDRQPFKPKREKTSKRTQVLSAEHHTTYALVTVCRSFLQRPCLDEAYRRTFGKLQCLECRASADTNVSVKAIHPLTCLTELGWRRDFRECTKGPKDKCFVHLAVDADRPLAVRSLRTMLPFASMSCHHYGKTIHIRCQIAITCLRLIALPCLALPRAHGKLKLLSQAWLSGMGNATGGM